MEKWSLGGYAVYFSVDVMGCIVIKSGVMGFIVLVLYEALVGILVEVRRSTVGGIGGHFASK